MPVAVVPHVLCIMIVVFPKGYICGLHGLTNEPHDTIIIFPPIVEILALLPPNVQPRITPRSELRSAEH